MEFNYPQLRQLQLFIWCLLDSYPVLSQVPTWSECKLSSWSFSGDGTCTRTAVGLPMWPGLPQSMAAELTPRASIPGDKRKNLHHLSCLISTANIGHFYLLAVSKGWPRFKGTDGAHHSEGVPSPYYKRTQGEDMRQPVLESTTSSRTGRQVSPEDDPGQHQKDE